LAAALAGAPAWAQAPDPAQWQGKWKSKEAGGEQSLKINDVTPQGFSLEFYEGVGGRNQGRVTGKAVFTGAATAKAVDEDRQCEATLTLSAAAGSREIEITDGNCNWWGGSYTMVPADTPVYFKTSYDCRKAASPVESAVCGHEVLAMGDLELARAYKAARDASPGNKRRELTAGQRAWVRARDEACGGPTANVQCLAGHYRRRILALRALADAKARTHAVDLTPLRASPDARNDPVLWLLLAEHLRIDGPSGMECFANAERGYVFFHACDTNCTPAGPARGHYAAYLGDDGAVWLAEWHLSDFHVVTRRDSGSPPAAIRDWIAGIKDTWPALGKDSKVGIEPALP
jgi:uncharacterized protein YecT (DUF1311 family)